MNDNLNMENTIAESTNARINWLLAKNVEYVVNGHYS